MALGEAPVQTVQAHPFTRSTILGCPLDRISLEQCVDHLDDVIQRQGQCYLCMINAAKVVKSRLDDDLKNVIHSADIVGADGMPVVWASRWLGQPVPGRLNGTDLMERLFERAHQKGYSLYLLGARQHVITRTVANLRKTFPNIRIAGYRNGYFNSIYEEKDTIKEINAARPDILLIGMGSPMKEYFVARHREVLQVPVIHGVGGSFDIWGGVTKRAPVWMQKHGLEWFYRFIQEPRRMWRRYLTTNTLFISMVLKEWVKSKFISNKRAAPSAKDEPL